MERYYIITGATGGIGGQLVQIGLQNRTLDKGCLIYKDHQKLVNSLGSYDLTVLDLLRYDMKEKPGVDLQPILEKNKEMDMIVLVLTSFSIVPIKKIAEQELGEITENINVNILAQLSILSEVLKYSKKNSKKLRIINIGSGAANHAIDGWSLYCASKSYINMYLKSLMLEEEIEVVSYDPGVVDTNMQSVIRSMEKDKFRFVQQFEDYYQNGSLNSPHEVAEDIWARYLIEWKAAEFGERYQKR